MSGVRSLRGATWLGVLTLLFGLATTALSPRAMGPLPLGMHTPVLALELAESHEEVERMFGAKGSDEREDYRLRMLRGTWLDFALICAYGLFLASAARRLGYSRHARFGYVAAALAIGAATFDVLENLELLKILGALGADYAGPLHRLALYSWPKWLLLGGYFALLLPGLHHANLALRLSGWLGALGGLCGLLSLTLGVRGMIAELMALGIALGMLLMTAGSLGRLRSPPAREPSRAVEASESAQSL